MEAFFALLRAAALLTAALRRSVFVFAAAAAILFLSHVSIECLPSLIKFSRAARQLHLFSVTLLLRYRAIAFLLLYNREWDQTASTTASSHESLHTAISSDIACTIAIISSSHSIRHSPSSRQRSGFSSSSAIRIADSQVKVVIVSFSDTRLLSAFSHIMNRVSLHCSWLLLIVAASLQRRSFNATVWVAFRMWRFLSQPLLLACIEGCF